MPILPAAIGIIFNSDQTRLLLIKRRDVPVWVLPGGGIEQGETPEEAVKREVYEETGLQVTITRKCAEYSPINRLATFTSVFICHVYAGEPCLSAEAEAIAFYPLSELPSAFFPIHASWLRDALMNVALVKRPLTEVSYRALAKYFVRHPWLILRYMWTRLKS